MNTTQLYVEPIIIGLLATVTFGMPFMPGLSTYFDIRYKEYFILFSGLFIGSTYTIGILADRVLDSCFEILEHHNRLQYILSRLKPRSSRDLFEEDKYRVRILAEEKKLGDWLSYVRTRIRILRGVAFFAPGMTCAGILTVMIAAQRPGVPHSSGGCRFLINSLAGFEFWLVPSVYLAMALLSIIFVPEKGIKEKDESEYNGHGHWKLPRSNQKDSVIKYGAFRGLTDKHEPKSRYIVFDIISQPYSFFGLILLAAAFAVAFTATVSSFTEAAKCTNVLAVCACRGVSLLGIAISGTILTLAAGWAWWRTTITFFTYLSRAESIIRQNEKSKES